MEPSDNEAYMSESNNLNSEKDTIDKAHKSNTEFFDDANSSQDNVNILNKLGNGEDTDTFQQQNQTQGESNAHEKATHTTEEFQSSHENEINKEMKDQSEHIGETRSQDGEAQSKPDMDTINTYAPCENQNVCETTDENNKQLNNDIIHPITNYASAMNPVDEKTNAKLGTDTDVNVVGNDNIKQPENKIVQMKVGKNSDAQVSEEGNFKQSRETKENGQKRQLETIIQTSRETTDTYQNRELENAPKGIEDNESKETEAASIDHSKGITENGNKKQLDNTGNQTNDIAKTDNATRLNDIKDSNDKKPGEISVKPSIETKDTYQNRHLEIKQKRFNNFDNNDNDKNEAEAANIEYSKGFTENDNNIQLENKDEHTNEKEDVDNKEQEIADSIDKNPEDTSKASLRESDCNEQNKLLENENEPKEIDDSDNKETETAIYQSKGITDNGFTKQQETKGDMTLEITYIDTNDQAKNSTDNNCTKPEETIIGISRETTDTHQNRDLENDLKEIEDSESKETCAANIDHSKRMSEFCIKKQLENKSEPIIEIASIGTKEQLKDMTNTNDEKPKATSNKTPKETADNYQTRQLENKPNTIDDSDKKEIDEANIDYLKEIAGSRNNRKIENIGKHTSEMADIRNNGPLKDSTDINDNDKKREDTNIWFSRENTDNYQKRQLENTPKETEDSNTKETEKDIDHTKGIEENDKNEQLENKCEQTNEITCIDKKAYEGSTNEHSIVSRNGENNGKEVHTHHHHKGLSDKDTEKLSETNLINTIEIKDGECNNWPENNCQRAKDYIDVVSNERNESEPRMLTLESPCKSRTENDISNPKENSDRITKEQEDGHDSRISEHPIQQTKTAGGAVNKMYETEETTVNEPVWEEESECDVQDKTDTKSKIKNIEPEIPGNDELRLGAHRMSPPLVNINSQFNKSATFKEFVRGNLNVEKTGDQIEGKDASGETEEKHTKDNTTKGDSDNIDTTHTIQFPTSNALSKDYSFPGQNDNMISNEASEARASTETHERSKIQIDNEQNIAEGNTKVTMGEFEQSHSLYFTGRLPTLELPEKNTDRNDTSYAVEAYCKVQEKEKNTNSSRRNEELTDESFEENGNITKENENVKRISTPSREIKRLIEEMNTPAQLYSLSKEKPLTPRDKKQSKTELSNLTQQPEDVENNSERDMGKHVTVSDLNTVTSEIMFEDFEKQSAAKYDDLPHMKNILEYTLNNEVRDPELNESSSQNMTHDDTEPRITRTVTEISDEAKHKTGEMHTDSQKLTNYVIEQTALANQHSITHHEEFINKTSHSETDLKAMIASAKQAVGDDETITETVTEGTSVINLKGCSYSSGAWKTDASTYGSNYDGLICSRCLCLDSEFVSSGFCHECQEYLCGQCRKLHKEAPETMHHYVMESFCTNELKIKKYIRATSYCKDCEIFLCGKCTVQHSGFRAFRHHTILQSSFISRQTNQKVPSSESSVSFNDTDRTEVEKEQNTSNEYEENRLKNRRKFIFESQSLNPYGFKFDKVSESLYPGKNKKLAISYTSKPNWPFSSIPALPYLVKPGSLQQRAQNNPYLQANKIPFHRKTTKSLETQTSVKLKALQARYNVEPERKTFRRKEKASFTARPLRSTEGVSLPDISSIQSYNMGGRHSHYGLASWKKSDKTNLQHAPNKLKKAEFIRDECLSIPFPSDELPCLIGGMQVLFDGRLVVLDKRNNNIKLFSRKFECIASLQFQNRIVDICASTIYPTDVYLATPKHIYEVNVKKGIEITRKIKVEIKRIEGIECWKYGIAIVSMKNDLTWEIRLLDFRGNLKSKLEILNPFTCEIEKSNRYHVVASKGGKYITLSDTKNACAICVDVTTRCVVSETAMLESKKPSYLTSDHQGNVYVSCGDEVQQVSAKGRNMGVVVKLEKDKVGRVGCIAYNTFNDQLFVQMKSDVIAIYRMDV